jgi:hypothetical protein
MKMKTRARGGEEDIAFYKRVRRGSVLTDPYLACPEKATDYSMVLILFDKY